jgi:hypothetical protein
VKFGELLQGLSTELSIASDQTLNETDKKLMELFRLVFNHYRVSDQLWKLKNHATDKIWKGEIPFEFGKDGADPVVTTAISLYHLPVYERTVPYVGKKYKSVPGDSVQRAWQAADATLQQATDLYYGRPTHSEK